MKFQAALRFNTHFIDIKPKVCTVASRTIAPPVLLATSQTPVHHLVYETLQHGMLWYSEQEGQQALLNKSVNRRVSGFSIQAGGCLKLMILKRQTPVDITRRPAEDNFFIKDEAVYMIHIPFDKRLNFQMIGKTFRKKFHTSCRFLKRLYQQTPIRK
ncbi:hypothetical protein PO124_30730 [Bacillus licheniformis]|nr:hypothetical protein [Bacillus licheniformis]